MDFKVCKVSRVWRLFEQGFLLLGVIFLSFPFLGVKGLVFIIGISRLCLCRCVEDLDGGHVIWVVWGYVDGRAVLGRGNGV